MRASRSSKYSLEIMENLCARAVSAMALNLILECFRFNIDLLIMFFVVSVIPVGNKLGDCFRQVKYLVKISFRQPGRFRDLGIG